MGDPAKGVSPLKARREISWGEFDDLVRKLALQVSGAAPVDAVVGIARGGAIVGCTLSFLLGKEFFPVRLKKQGGATRVVVPPPPDVAGLDIALVDDLSQSGDTFKIAQWELRQLGARRVTTCALVRREPGFRPDLFALEVTTKVRFPWATGQLVDGQIIKR
jgi:hypoxanthine phosphoribosyltransferase